jgi:hypothetical protein
VNPNTPLVCDYDRKEKVECFLKEIPKSAYILEVGCGNSGAGDYIKKKGWG